MNKSTTRMAFKEARTQLRNSLKQFLDSDRNVQIVYSTAQSHHARGSAPTPVSELTRSLYVLDSSFNPPSLAHLRMARSAVLGDVSRGAVAEPKRLLFLLATTNADKESKMETFEDRLLMMQVCAQEMWQDMVRALQQRQKINEEDCTDAQVPPIDVGVTKKAYFHEKAAALEREKIYNGEPEQIHLTGFDTCIRIFNTRYYEPDRTFRSLEPMFRRHRLRVTLRTDDEWGDREAQEQYIRDIADGKRDHEGARKEWAEKIQLVEGRREGEKPISSTRARKAAGEQDWETLQTLVPSSVLAVIQAENLYGDG